MRLLCLPTSLEEREGARKVPLAPCMLRSHIYLYPYLPCTNVPFLPRQVLKHEIKAGTRVWMPRGTVHTFMASTEGLLVESIHNPWIPFENSGCITYPKEKVVF